MDLKLTVAIRESLARENRHVLGSVCPFSFIPSFRGLLTRSSGFFKPLSPSSLSNSVRIVDLRRHPYVCISATARRLEHVRLLGFLDPPIIDGTQPKSSHRLEAALPRQECFGGRPFCVAHTEALTRIRPE
jgi:hypothetical protein